MSVANTAFLSVLICGIFIDTDISAGEGGAIIDEIHRGSRPDDDEFDRYLKRTIRESEMVLRAEGAEGKKRNRS